MAKQVFRGKLESGGEGGAWVILRVPFDVEQEFGAPAASPAPSPSSPKPKSSASTSPQRAKDVSSRGVCDEGSLGFRGVGSRVCV